MEEEGIRVDLQIFQCQNTIVHFIILILSLIHSTGKSHSYQVLLDDRPSWCSTQTLRVTRGKRVSQLERTETSLLIRTGQTESSTLPIGLRRGIVVNPKKPVCLRGSGQSTNMHVSKISRM